MIAEIIKQLQSDNWYGCSDIIEVAKGKNSMPKDWKEVKNKVNRSRHMEAARRHEGINNTGIIKNIQSWLLKRK